MFYAQIDEKKICIAISDLLEETNAENMVQIEEFDSSLIGKRFNGKTWEHVEKEEAPHSEHQEPDQSIAILEGLASLSEEFDTFKETQKTITENQMAILEGLAGAFEAQGAEV